MHAYTEFFPHRGAGDALDTLPLIRQGLAGPPARVVIAGEHDAMTVAQLRQRIAGWQHWLAARGLGPGRRVAVMLNNSAEHVALIYALIVSGIVWVPVNTRHRGPGLQYVLDHAEIDLLLVEHAFGAVVAEAPWASEKVAYLDDVETQLSTDDDVQFASLRHNDTLCIIYTSGTTGAPKGVAFTHRMLRIASEAVLQVADVRAGDKLFLWEPLCHIGGAQMLLVPFMAEANLFMVPRFSASRFWAQMQQAQATQLHYLGGILDILMHMPVDAGPRGNDLRVAWGAGISAGSWHDIRRRLGCAVRECYGMTECSSFATLNAIDKPGSIGRALPWLTVQLLDDAGRDVAVGEIGEIVLSSPVEGVFLPAYIDDEAATARAMRAGRLYTGDSGRRDADGDLYFVGRRTDSMRVRGENVSAWEVERAYVNHPVVQATAAVGVGSAIGEQEILLYVQFKPEQHASWEALAIWAQTRLAAFQQPRYYQQVLAFETTPSERIRKHLLARDPIAAWDRCSNDVVAAEK